MTHLRRLVVLLAVFLAGASVAHALTTPERSGWVTDEAGIIDSRTASELAGALAELQRKTGAEVVVVTLKSLQGASIETWGDVLGESWNVGRSDGKDKGALLIVAPNDRKARIAVGYGLGDRLSDSTAAQIVANVILPSFRRGDFMAGIRSGVDSIAAKIEGRAVATTLAVERSSAPVFAMPSSFSVGTIARLIIKAILVLVVLALVVLIMRKLGNLLSGSGRVQPPRGASTPPRRWDDDNDDNILGSLLSNRGSSTSWSSSRSSSSSSSSSSWPSSRSSSSSSSSRSSGRSFGGGASGSW